MKAFSRRPLISSRNSFGLFFGKFYVLSYFHTFEEKKTLEKHYKKTNLFVQKRPDNRSSYDRNQTVQEVSL